MYWLKNCPKCHGDLFENTDFYGGYLDCFQCGHYLTAVEEALARMHTTDGKKARARPAKKPVRVLEEIAA